MEIDPTEDAPISEARRCGYVIGVAVARRINQLVGLTAVQQAAVLIAVADVWQVIDGTSDPLVALDTFLELEASIQ